MSQDTEQSQQSPREIHLFRVGGKIPLNVYEGDRPVFQCHTPEDAARFVDLLNTGETPAAKDREIAELREGLKQSEQRRHDEVVMVTKKAIYESDLEVAELKKQIEALNEENSKLKGGALREAYVNLSDDYSKLEKQRDALAEALKEVPNLPKVMDPGASDKWKEAYETAINDVRVLFSTKLASVNEQKQKTPKP